MPLVLPSWESAGMGVAPWGYWVGLSLCSRALALALALKAKEEW